MAAGDAPGRLDDLEARVRRAPAAIGRFARELLLTARQPVGTLRVLTFSASGAVRATLESIARIASLRVACGEGQPRREGRALAAGLALAGVDVELFPDAAITAALDGADAVVVGADAVLPDHFINKAGTRGLAAAGAAAGVPVFVLAGREKFLPGELARHLLAPDGSSDEIWAAAPAGVHVRNPYFESIPLNLASGVVTDVGLLAGEAIAACCRAAGTCLDAETIAVLAGERPHPPATRQP
jgi:translation initiation factor 2B subunit (eIF-2B alpha/beta/delta family)